MPRMVDEPLRQLSTRGELFGSQVKPLDWAEVDITHKTLAGKICWQSLLHISS